MNTAANLYGKAAVFLLTVLVSVFGWMGKNIYDSTQIIDKRLTIVESTLIDRTEAVKRLAVLEHRVDKLEAE
jgi:hypothetical protein